MKHVTPLIFLGVSAVTDFLLFLIFDPAFWEAHLARTVIVFGIVMACGAAFDIGPVISARRTERFLLGSRRTNWLLDEQVEILPGVLDSPVPSSPERLAGGSLHLRCTDFS